MIERTAGDALDLLTSLRPEERARPALVTETATWSYGDLARAAAVLAADLQGRGVQPPQGRGVHPPGGSRASRPHPFEEVPSEGAPGTRVAFVATPSPEVVLTIVTLAAMGVTLVPIHPRLSAAEARVVIDVARADHVLDPDELTRAARAALDGGGVPGAAQGSSSMAHAPVHATLHAHVPASAPAAPFAVVSTSGTTGRPKGAVLSRRAFLASAEASARNLGWRDDDRWLLHMPLAHVGGLSIVTRCLAARRAMVLLPRFDPALVLDAIPRHRVTLLSVVPTMMHALLEADTANVLATPRALLLGGAASSPALLDICAARRVRVLTTYGLTEACSQVTTQPPRDPSIRLTGSGPRLDGFALRIAAPDGAPLPTGTPGRILVAGPALFDGYLTADGGALDPARTADDHFDTGDIGELDDRGHLHVHVRRTDLVVTGGENVYPVEVEQTLERTPGVRRALVFGVPDERWGQIVAAVIEADPTADPAALTCALAALSSTALAPHKRPRRIAFVSELLLTPSGKVDRKDAPARFASLLRPFP